MASKDTGRSKQVLTNGNGGDGDNPDPTTPPAAATAATAPADSDPAQADAARDAQGRRAYDVTKLAGLRVAGRRVKAGQDIALTDEAARAELLKGAIVPKGKDLPAKLKPKAETSDETAA